jgi:Zn finger protein HypA/HybF involved in hydrogenase expression
MNIENIIYDKFKTNEFKKQELDWKQSMFFISKKYTPYKCEKCNTFWTKITFICNGTCPNCKKNIIF